MKIVAYIDAAALWVAANPKTAIVGFCLAAWALAAVF
jgi:hypothetical protein